MGSKSLMFLGLLFAVTILISSSMVSVSARADPATVTETKSDVEVDGYHGGGHYGGGHYGGGHGGGHYGGGHGGGGYGGGGHGGGGHGEESGSEADGHYKPKPKKCKHWPHC